MGLVMSIIELVTQLATLATKAATAKEEAHDKIVAEAQAAWDAFQSSLAGLTVKLAEDDAKADTAIAEALEKRV